jgi:nifR3 family TIM-barrel protein
MLDWTDDERPISAQVFGSVPEIVAEGAKVVEEAGADIIEINMGCPAPKVVSSGSGSALLKDLAKSEAMISSVIRAVSIPVVVKTRKGWSTDIETAVEIARMVENHGGAGVTVHGRTAVQRFTGEADWEIIRRVKESVNIPVIGNGDVKTPEDVARMFDETGCDGVMIGRAAVGNPWIFDRSSKYLTTGIVPLEPDFSTHIEWARRHARLLVACVGEKRGSQEMRGHIAVYLKGVPGAAAIRAKIMTTQNLVEIEEVLDEARSQCESGVVAGR